MYLLNLHFPGKSYELSSLFESLLNSSYNWNTKSMPAVQASMGHCACRMHTRTCPSTLKFLSQSNSSIMHYKKFCILQRRYYLEKKLQPGATRLLYISSLPGFLSLRKLHSRIPHVTNSLLDCEHQPVQLNTD